MVVNAPFGDVPCGGEMFLTLSSPLAPLNPDHLRGSQRQGQPGQLLPLRPHEPDPAGARSLGLLHPQVHGGKM